MHFGSMRLIQSSIVSIWWVLSGALDPDSSADEYEIKWACDEDKHVMWPNDLRISPIMFNLIFNVMTNLFEINKI